MCMFHVAEVTSSIGNTGTHHRGKGAGFHLNSLEHDMQENTELLKHWESLYSLNHAVEGAVRVRHWPLVQKVLNSLEHAAEETLEGRSLHEGITLLQVFLLMSPAPTFSARNSECGCFCYCLPLWENKVYLRLYFFHFLMSRL